MAKAMAEIYKQGSKLNGVPLENVMKVGAVGQPGSGPAVSSPKNASASDQHPADQQSQPSSLTGAMAGALGQHFGFGHKKKQDAAASDTSSSGAPSGSGPDSLIEMTSHSSNFSTGPVDASLFEVPAGYSQVNENLESRSAGR
jgi:hypothetical protein